MEPEELPDADELWWSWVMLAALHRAVDDPRCRFDADELVLSLDAADGSWLRMQRSHGRAALWGRSALAPPTAPDARRGAPDWALTEATEDEVPTFLAWHVHGEWDTSAPHPDEGALHLLRPLLTVEPRAVELARSGTATTETLAAYSDGEHLEDAVELVRRAGADAPRHARGSVGLRLRDQIHGQMRDAVEADRVLLQRPPALVQWSRINGPGTPFDHAVMVVRDRFVPAETNTALPETEASTLANVLAGLHRDEAGDESGGWLFARVTSDGVSVRFDRVFDSWPEWYAVRHPRQGPTLDDLAWEMGQRAPRWRPAWASLLPRH